jgi:hypothetical protein
MTTPPALHGIGSSGRSAAATAAENEMTVLNWTKRFGGWITPDLVAHIIWPRSQPVTALKSAQALLRRIAKEARLIARELRDRGQVYVLTKRGAERVQGASATNWGRAKDGQWTPPDTFDHNLRTARLLVALYVNGHEVRTGSDLNRRYGSTGRGADAGKVADGLFRVADRKEWVWLETEGERKSGPHMNELAKALYLISAGRGDEYERKEALMGEAIRLGGVAVLLPPPSRLNKDGHHIDHRLRIRHAIHRAASETEFVDIARVSIQTFTVADDDPWLWHHERDIIELRLSGEDRVQDAGWLSGSLAPVVTSPEKEEAENIAAVCSDPFGATHALLGNINQRTERRIGHMEHERNIARNRASALAAELEAATRRLQIAEAKAKAAETRAKNAESRTQAAEDHAKVAQAAAQEAREREKAADAREHEATRELRQLREHPAVKLFSKR